LIDLSSLWKETQISYLKTLQTGDLRRRRDVHPKTNAMFLAYEVKPAPNGAALEQPLLLDLSQVYNLPSYARNQDFVRGEVLGFCEITQRPYGLGSIDETEIDRTVLTNLAVAQIARELGIGSKLIDECERHVAREWNLNEIILEVEDDNTQALDFYAKRGYETIFSDPASRRFDVSGLILRKVRCTRRIMRKVLTLQRAQSASDEIKTRSFEFFQQLLPKIGV
jgi:ribosomal protein S18 acetylase RimI-like enzyme